MMRRIAYVSTSIKRTSSAVPEDLSRIIMHGRRSNGRNQITGILVYNEGCYFQVIEGETDAVASLIERIKNDTRHCDFTIFVDEPIDKRLFGASALKLSTASSIGDAFKNLIGEAWPLISRLPQRDLRRIAKLHDPGKDSGERDEASLFYRDELELLEFRLKAYPRISGTQDISHDYLEISARLMSGWTSLETLISRLGYERDAMQLILHRLHEQDILRIRSKDKLAQSPTPSQDSVRAPTRFYSKLRNLFKRAA
ncbi:MAG: BLUF domain-containing protein [Marinobacter sp.]